MASLTIVTRAAKDGPRYLIRFRLGGRAYPWVHAGSFRTQKEAKVRRDLVAGEIAAGRNPADVLRALATSPATVVGLETWGERFLASRIDVDVNTRKNYGSAIKKINETFGDRAPSTITATEIAEWIATLAETRKPGTLGQYLIAFRLLLDHVGLEPNAARDARVKLPKQVRDEPQPPSREHFEAIVEALGAKWKLLFVTIEQGALRLGEAVSLRWADVDAAGLRLRLPRSATKRTVPAGCTCPTG